MEAGTEESETERWARERRERRQARARRKVQRTGEVNSSGLNAMQEEMTSSYNFTVYLQGDDNDGEEEFSGSGLDPQVVSNKFVLLLLIGRETV